MKEHFRFNVLLYGIFGEYVQEKLSYYPDWTHFTEIKRNELLRDNSYYKDNFILNALGTTKNRIMPVNSIAYLIILFFDGMYGLYEAGETYLAANDSVIISSYATNSLIHLTIESDGKGIKEFFSGLYRSGKFSRIEIDVNTSDKYLTEKLRQQYKIQIARPIGEETGSSIKVVHYINNSRNEKAYIGDYIKLTLASPKSHSAKVTITDIQDNYIVVDEKTVHYVADIVNFNIINRNCKKQASDMVND